MTVTVVVVTVVVVSSSSRSSSSSSSSSSSIKFTFLEYFYSMLRTGIKCFLLVNIFCNNKHKWKTGQVQWLHSLEHLAQFHLGRMGVTVPIRGGLPHREILNRIFHKNRVSIALQPPEM